MPRKRKPEEGEESEGGRPRGSFWTGTISFGLVSVPVELVPVSRPARVALRMLGPDGAPLQRRYHCSREGREIDRSHIVRGYEIERGEYVVVTDEELARLEPRKSRDIDLERFVPAEEIDPIYFDHAYLLVPANENTKAYRLLAEAMEQSGRAGLGTFVMRDREYWVAIFAERGILRAQTLRFPEEIRPAAVRGELPQPSRSDVLRFDRAIERLEARSLDKDELADRRTERALALIERKRRTGRNLVHAPEASEEQPAGGQVVDLLAKLKESLGRRPSAARKGRGRG